MFGINALSAYLLLNIHASALSPGDWIIQNAANSSVGAHHRPSRDNVQFNRVTPFR